jgi:hypothetical protein
MTIFLSMSRVYKLISIVLDIIIWEQVEHQCLDHSYFLKATL